MTTTYNLSINSVEDDPAANKGMNQSTNVRTDNPADMLALIQKLAGIAAPAEPVAHSEPSPCGCGTMEDQPLEEQDEDLANAPKPKTMADLRDLVDTGHVPAVGVTNPRPGDNPMVDLEENSKEKAIADMEQRLIREWHSDKLSKIAEEFDSSAADRAISQGLDSYVAGVHEFAVRNDNNRIKVFPILEDRVMTQVPLYVVENYAETNESSGDTPIGQMSVKELADYLGVSEDQVNSMGIEAARQAAHEKTEDMGVDEEVEQVDEKFRSQAQARLMHAAADDPAVAARTGVDQETAQEFVKAHDDKKRKEKALARLSREGVEEGALDDAFPDLGNAAKGLQNLGGKKVDPNSLEVELGPDPYLTSATWMDGTPLTPEELAQWQQDHPEEFRQAVQHQSMSKLDEENKQVDEDLNYIKMLLNKWR